MHKESMSGLPSENEILQPEQIKDLVLETLDDYKALDTKAINTNTFNSLTDWMVFASGSSGRHVKSLTDNLTIKMKQKAIKPLGIEGRENATWALVDLGEVLVHIMQKDVREYYQLEKLWSTEKEVNSNAG